MRPQELFSSQSKALRAHSLDWARTSKPDGFAHLNEQFRAMEAYQFQLSKHKGRVHGFFVDVTFHVVWLDPDHNLYD